MPTRGPGSAADHPWNEIVPGLSMGGHLYLDPATGDTPVVVGSEFEVVVSLFQCDGHGPAAGTEHHFLDIPDRPLEVDQLIRVSGLVAVTADAVGAGRRVLVRCQYGYNRSGLVTAAALVRLGHPIEDAIALIRRKRSEWALHNQAFVEYLMAGLPQPPATPYA